MSLPDGRGPRPGRDRQGPGRGPGQRSGCSTPAPTACASTWGATWRWPDSRPTAQAWAIGVDDWGSPVGAVGRPAQLALAQGGVATSATTARRWTTDGGPGPPPHRPGHGPAQSTSAVRSVTVLAAQAMWAEVVAKAALLAGPTTVVGTCWPRRAPAASWSTTPASPLGRGRPGRVPGMNVIAASPLPWYVARACGLTAWALAWASVVMGLALSTRALGRRPEGAVAQRPAPLPGRADRRLRGRPRRRPADATGTSRSPPSRSWCPTPPTGSPGAVAWGIAAFYLLLAVEVTSLLMRRISRAGCGRGSTSRATPWRSAPACTCSPPAPTPTDRWSAGRCSPCWRSPPSSSSTGSAARAGGRRWPPPEAGQGTDPQPTRGTGRSGRELTGPGLQGGTGPKRSSPWPRPGRVRISSLPPDASAVRRAMSRPSPVDPAPLVPRSSAASGRSPGPGRRRPATSQSVGSPAHLDCQPGPLRGVGDHVAHQRVERRLQVARTAPGPGRAPAGSISSTGRSCSSASTCQNADPGRGDRDQVAAGRLVVGHLAAGLGDDLVHRPHHLVHVGRHPLALLADRPAPRRRGAGR